MIKNASDDYADLDAMAKIKMVKSNLTACNKVKDRLKKILGEAKAVVSDIESLKEALDTLQRELAAGTLMEQAKAAHEAEKTTVKDAYIFVYG